MSSDFPLNVNGNGGGAGHASNLILIDLVVLFAQLFTAVAVTTPVRAVEGYDTTILVVPWPETIVPAAGTVHKIEVALEGNAGNEYVNCLSGQTAV